MQIGGRRPICALALGSSFHSLNPDMKKGHGLFDLVERRCSHATYFSAGVIPFRPCVCNAETLEVVRRCLVGCSAPFACVHLANAHAPSVWMKVSDIGTDYDGNAISRAFEGVDDKDEIVISAAAR